MKYYCLRVLISDQSHAVAAKVAAAIGAEEAGLQHHCVCTRVFKCTRDTPEWVHSLQSAFRLDSQVYWEFLNVPRAHFAQTRIRDTVAPV